MLRFAQHDIHVICTITAHSHDGEARDGAAPSALFVKPVDKAALIELSHKGGIEEVFRLE